MEPADEAEPARGRRAALGAEGGRVGDAFAAFEQAGWREGRAAHYHAALGGITEQPVETLLDAAGVGPGVRVLDVATGPGYAAARAAARGAEVVGVDFAAPMVELARELHPGVEFREGDAGDLPFGDAAFDAVIANFLMPHVTDLPAVVAELARVTRAGGRVALTTWDPDGAVVARGVPEAVAAADASPPADLPEGPPFFQYALDDEFAALLAGAGLADPAVSSFAFTHRIDDLDAFWADLVAGTVRINASVTRQPPEVRARIRAEFERLLDPYRGASGGFDVPCVVRVGAATRRG